MYLRLDSKGERLCYSKPALSESKKKNRRMITVRHEEIGDVVAVRELNEQAFGGATEADLVEALHTSKAVTLSLVAVDETKIVGHIVFSPAEIVSEGSEFLAVALGPMAVLPARQRQGVGSRLVHRGLELLRDAGHGVVVVVGHPEYYPRFGFALASKHGIRCPFEVPDEAFMVLELQAGALQGREGTVRYHPAFEPA